MKRKTLALITLILLVTSLLSSLCFAEEVIYGVTKGFNPRTGKLVLQTSQGEFTVYLSKTVTVYVKTRLGGVEVPETWEFLLDNLFEGTKVRIQISDKLVSTIIVMEVPQ